MTISQTYTASTNRSVRPRKTSSTGSNKDIAFLPYNKYSKGYRALAKALDLKYPTVAHLESLANESPTGGVKIPFLVNWGSGSIPGWLKLMAGQIINETSAVNICRNKLKFFTTVKDHARIPVFTEDFEQAFAWVKEGTLTMGRKVTGSCGTDIVFYEDGPGAFQASDFWSQYKKKKHEFRVHIFKGEVISLQQKAIRTSDEQGQPIPVGAIDFRIRNHRNGFIFKRNDINVPNDVLVQAKAAFNAIPGLTFGAIDVIYNQYEDKGYVLEINTAPGLEGTTLDDYVGAFRSL